ncbi:MAG: energy-coupling factor transporter transmembrane protein EcfT [Anaerolineae bacterium]|nr:energy-coupling factor transporter transmembrane protein EcfT [Anaerolineae bacterium]
MFASFQYIPGQSFVHRLDPRTKLIAFLLVVVCTIILDDARLLLALFALSLAYYLLARLPWRTLWRAWAFVLFFAIFLVGGFSTILFGQPPAQVTTLHPLLTLPPITLPIIGTFQKVIAWETVFLGFARMLRPLAIMAMILPFSFTTSPYLYGVAFRKLGLSDGVAFALDLAMRYVPTIARDFFITVDAQRARGYELEAKAAGIINMIRRAAPLMVPVTIHAIAGGEEVVEAMELRAFGVGRRTWSEADTLHLKTADYVVLGLAVLVLLTCLGLRWFTSYGSYWFPAEWFA